VRFAWCQCTAKWIKGRGIHELIQDSSIFPGFDLVPDFIMISQEANFQAIWQIKE